MVEVMSVIGNNSTYSNCMNLDDVLKMILDYKERKIDELQIIINGKEINVDDLITVLK